MSYKPAIPEDRFWAKVIIHPEGCWEWTGWKNNGYGGFYGPPQMPAHRFSFLLANGYLPAKGRHIDHLCRNRGCVNPTHLEDVAHRENLLRGKTLPAANLLKTHCPKGHPYDYIHPNGGRRCKVCNKELMARGRANGYIAPSRRK